MLKRNAIFYALVLSIIFHGCVAIFYSNPARYPLITSNSPTVRSVLTFTPKSTASTQTDLAPASNEAFRETPELPTKPASHQTPIAIFHDASTLTTRPSPAETIEFADLSTSTSNTGSASIKVMIDANGRVVEIVVIESSFEKDTELLVIDAIKRTQFLPGTINGESVPSRAWVEIKLEAAQAS